MKILNFFNLLILPIMLFSNIENYDIEIGLLERNYFNYMNLPKSKVMEYMDDFIANIYCDEITNNDGGMKASDMFSFYLTLRVLEPKVVIESGVWKGASTYLIRKTLGEECIILALDPDDFISNQGWKDTNKNTIYILGDEFKDFSDLNFSEYLNSFGRENIVVFFDDHIDAIQRLSQCVLKGFKYVFFNDNYPINLGSHTTLEHLFNTEDVDLCKKSRINMTNEELISHIKNYNLFPNTFPAMIQTLEGSCTCVHYLNKTEENKERYEVFQHGLSAYRWNTLVELK